jgi:hypothetical protein
VVEPGGRARKSVRVIGMRTLLVVALVGMMLWWTAAAGAKILPVTSVSLAPAQPAIGQPFDVVVRFAPGFHIGDYPWENDEVVLLPAAQTDSAGWPRVHDFGGTPVPLRSISNTVYRGHATVDRPGDYVVVARSSVYAHEDDLQGFVSRPLAPPVRVHVAAAPESSSWSGWPGWSGWSTWSAVALAIALAIGLAIGVALTLRTRRRVGAFHATR